MTKHTITLELPSVGEITDFTDVDDRDAAIAERIEILVAAAAQLSPVLEEIRQLDLALSRVKDRSGAGYRRVTWPMSNRDHVRQANLELESGTANRRAAVQVAEVKEAAAESQRSAVSAARSEERRHFAPSSRDQLLRAPARWIPSVRDRR
jgi:hypothetical protein